MTVRDESAPTSPFQEFVRTEAATGALLVICTIVVLCVANSPWADAYHRLWTTPVAVVRGGHTLSLTLHQWINDGLMSVFFLLVGLEIATSICVDVCPRKWRCCSRVSGG
jgi:Na+:H+ antiporter, NhaA family